MFLSLTRQFIFYLPLLYSLPHIAAVLVPGTTGLMAITFTESAADFCSVVVVTLFQIHEGRRIRRLQEGQRNGTVAAPVEFVKAA